MPLPTQPPDAGGFIPFFKGYFDLVWSFGKVLFTSRESVIIDSYAQLLKSNLTADFWQQPNAVLLPRLRELTAQQLTGLDGKIPDIEAIMRMEQQLSGMARCQAVWALFWLVTPSGSYLVWQLLKLFLQHRQTDSIVLMICSLAVILIFTMVLAIIGLVIWSKLSSPFMQWCQRHYGFTILPELTAPDTEEEK